MEDMVYAVIFLTKLEGLADPPLRSIAAGKVPPSAQGDQKYRQACRVLRPSSARSSSRSVVFTGMNAPFVFAGMPYGCGSRTGFFTGHRGGAGASNALGRASEVFDRYE